MPELKYCSEACVPVRAAVYIPKLWKAIGLLFAPACCDAQQMLFDDEAMLNGGGETKVNDMAVPSIQSLLRSALVAPDPLNTQSM